MRLWLPCMNGFDEAERWKDIIGITIFFVFVGGIVLAICGDWLTYCRHKTSAKKLIAIGVFSTLAALIASLFEPL